MVDAKLETTTEGAIAELGFNSKTVKLGVSFAEEKDNSAGKTWHVNTFEVKFRDLSKIPEASYGDDIQENLWPLGNAQLTNLNSLVLSPVEIVTELVYNEKSQSFWFTCMNLKTSTT